MLLVTGLMFWRPWFAPYFRIGTHCASAVLLHALGAVVLILLIIMHVYAAFWVKGTMRAMTRGTVTRGLGQGEPSAVAREMTKATSERRRRRPGAR